MSATAPLRRPAALRLPATAPAREATKATSRPRLVLISQRRTTAGRLPFMILVGGILTVGLVGVLLLHMVAAQDAYRADQMQAHLAALTDQEQQLATAVEADSSPATLKERALALGMRPTTVTSFKQLKDGRAIGVQVPVALPPPVTHMPKTSRTDTTTKTDTTAKTDVTGRAGATTGATLTKAGGKTGTATTQPTGTAATTTATTTGTTTAATGDHHKGHH